MSKSLLSISNLVGVDNPTIPGYFVVSTAPINVEGDNLPAHKQEVQFHQKLTTQSEDFNLIKIANLIYDKLSQENSESVEIIISTNGFSSSKEKTQRLFEELHSYINKDKSIQTQSYSKSLIFIGYRWPSEPLVGGNSWWWEKLVHAIAALPTLPRIILMFGSLGILISIFFKPKSLLVFTPFSFIFSILILILTTLFFFVITLVILRLFIYFRDTYRATNFGVPDLVELVRQLDKGVVSLVKDEYIHQISLIGKLKILLLQKVKNKLILEQIPVTDQEKLALDFICEKVIHTYCKDKSSAEIKIEDIDNQLFTKTNKIIQKEYLEKVVNIANKIIKQDTDPEFVKIRERVLEILENKAKNYWNSKNRIKLTFIGHSLGGYVVTNVVRILSDVFDLNSVGTLGLSDKLPTSDIGRVFSLERLVLVAPDIPISTILLGRANFLRSSLRRFKEAYLFSNEGDLALRLASTVANYFSFPARTRESGYRLGNLAIRDYQGYGISPYNNLQPEQHISLLKLLYINSFNSRSSLAKIQDSYQVDETEDREQIARLFTYFDCTDYTDRTIEPNSKKRRILTLAKWRWEPRLFYYFRLIIAYSLGIIDTHGGYFQGESSQQLMYRLAFLGFGGFLDSLNPENRISALNYLAQECHQKKIQMILSPERYQVDILGHDRKQVRREMLNS
ncbi:MAG TPA: hypothetical protein V6D14_08400 [Coleofasciculaceae cyanobacterium]|jgi:hypothetical protein